MHSCWDIGLSILHLSVKRKVVKPHGADEVYLRGLGVHDVLVPGDPQPGVPLQHAHHLECLQVVDEDVWQPEQVDQLQVDGYEGLRVNLWALLAPGPVVAGVTQDPGRNVQPRLPPHDVKVGTKLDSIFLEN